MVLSQDISLSGVLVDGVSLSDLSGVHIYTKKHIGTTTDIDGNFTFKVHHLDTLHFSRVGYDSLAMVITETDRNQNLFISMKRSIRMLDDVEINAVFQANTILKRPKQERLKVRGFNYSDKPYEEGYHMGLSALASPMTALYRIFSKRYKEEKKNYKILKARKLEDVVFTRASDNLSTVLKMSDEYIDEYFYRDFIQNSGLTVRFVAESSEYDLLVALPRAISTYQTYLLRLKE
ncbi:MAG: hypothetical protein ACI8TA_003551 [Cyclobacteriaceae bacterium]